MECSRFLKNRKFPEHFFFELQYVFWNIFFRIFFRNIFSGIFFFQLFFVFYIKIKKNNKLYCWHSILYYILDFSVSKTSIFFLNIIFEFVIFWLATIKQNCIKRYIHVYPLIFYKYILNSYVFFLNKLILLRTKIETKNIMFIIFFYFDIKNKK